MTDVLSWEELNETLTDDQIGALERTVKVGVANDERLSRIRDTYRAPGLTLVLGAGVSISAGLPSWDELLSGLQLRALAQAVDLPSETVLPLSLVYREALGQNSPLVAARIARSILRGEAFLEAVRNLVYRPTRDMALVDGCALLAAKNEHASGVLEILTYNYDSLVEEALQGIGRQWNRVDRGDLGSIRLDVRHVHGWLGRERSEKEWIVLSEEAYHEEYADPYSWSNTTQMNAFSQGACLFVGSSLSDPNTRRLLEISRKHSSAQHAAILRRTQPERVRNDIEASWSRRGRPATAQNLAVDRRVQLLCDLADQVRDTSLLELGVEVIWVQSHDVVVCVFVLFRTP